MIVVLGRPGLALAEADGARPLGGLAALIALEAARRKQTVELVGSVGEDPAGDAVAVTLGAAGVGHAALLRDPAGVTPDASLAVIAGRAAPPLPRLDAADVELGLRYLAECRVLVVADDLDEAAAAATMDAAAYHGAPVVAIVSAGAGVPDAWDRGATVLSAPDAEDEDGPVDPAPFAKLVAGFAIGLEEGRPVGEALERAVSGGGWERAEDE